MAKYTLYFKIEKPERIGENEICRYHLRFVENATKNILYETTTTYTPVSLKPQDMNDWRNGIVQAARMRVRKELGIAKDVTSVCVNDKSWFLTKGEKISKTRSNAKAPVVEISTEERLYTVVQEHGVWTIKKVETQLLTEEEAKTLLFKKIVNGED